MDRENIIHRLFRKRSINEGGCWEWTGAKSNGYGTVRLPLWMDATNRVVKVHRLSANLFLGFDLVDPREIAHRCDNKRCFNPEHLFPASHAENMLDMADKGYMKGSANWRAKLNEHRVARIKLLLSCGVPFGEVAPLFGVKPATIWMIAKGKSWKHVMA